MKKSTETRKKLVVKIALVAIFLSLAAPFAGAVFGEEIVVAEEPAVTGITGFVKVEGRSRYLGANGAIFYNDRATVTQFDISRGGWYADIWVSSSGGSGSWKDDFGDEVDYTIGYAVEDGKWNYDVGVAYFDIVGEELGFDNVINPYLKLSRSMSWGSPYLKVEHYMPAGGSLPTSGQQYHVGVSTSGFLFPHVGGRWSGSTTLDVFYDTGAFDFDRGLIGSVEVSAQYNVGGFSVGPTLKWMTPISSMDDGRMSASMVSISLTRAF